MPIFMTVAAMTHMHSFSSQDSSLLTLEQYIRIYAYLQRDIRIHSIKHAMPILQIPFRNSSNNNKTNPEPANSSTLKGNNSGSNSTTKRAIDDLTKCYTKSARSSNARSRTKKKFFRAPFATTNHSIHNNANAASTTTDRTNNSSSSSSSTDSSSTPLHVVHDNVSNSSSDHNINNDDEEEHAARILYLTEACAEFDHYDVRRHDEELMEYGAANVLNMVLSIVMNEKSKNYYFFNDHNHNHHHHQQKDELYFNEHEHKHDDLTLLDDYGRTNNNEYCINHPMTTTTTATTADDDELRMLCSGLEMIYRASPEAIYSSFKEVGSSLIPLLLRLLEEYESNHHTALSNQNCNQNQNNSLCLTNNKSLSLTSSVSHPANTNGSYVQQQQQQPLLKASDVTSFNICKILLYFSRVTYVRAEIVHQIMGLLPALLRGLDVDIIDDDSSSSSECPSPAFRSELRAIKLRSLANLSHHKENKRRIMMFPGVPEVLCKSALRSEKEREFCSILIMNLAADAQNQVFLCKCLNGAVITTLVKLSENTNDVHVNLNVNIARSGGASLSTPKSYSQSYGRGGSISHSTVGLNNNTNNNEEEEESSSVASYNSSSAIATATATLEHVAMALQTLAFSKENRIRLVNHEKGLVVDALLNCVRNRSNVSVRRRAAGALMNLACHETAVQLSGHLSMLSTLAMAATNDPSLDSEVMSRAASALSKISDCITRDMAPSHSNLLSALVKASSGRNVDIVTAIFRYMARDEGNREVMAKHGGLVEALGTIVLREMASKRARENAAKTLMHLANSDENRLIMTYSRVLDNFVRVLHLEGEEIVKMRDSAITALARLAADPANRKLMARHDGLLVAMAKAVEFEIRRETKDSNAVTIAKPALVTLLMSL